LQRKFSGIYLSVVSDVNAFVLFSPKHGTNHSRTSIFLENGCPSSSSHIVGTESGRRHVLQLDSIMRLDCAVMVRTASSIITMVVTVLHSVEKDCGVPGAELHRTQITLSAPLANYKSLDLDKQSPFLHLQLMSPTNFTSAARSLTTLMLHLNYNGNTEMRLTAIQMRAWLNGRIKLLSVASADSKSWTIEVDSAAHPDPHTTITCQYSSGDYLERSSKSEGDMHSDDTINIHWTVQYVVAENSTFTDKTVTKRVTTQFRITPDVVYSLLPMLKDENLINTAVLSGKQASVPMKIFAVTEAGDLNDVTSNSHCLSSESRVLKSSPTCSSLYVDGSELRGMGKIKVHVHFEALTTSVEITVWYPRLPITVWISDPILNAVKDWQIAVWKWLPGSRRRREARQFGCVNRITVRSNTPNIDYGSAPVVVAEDAVSVRRLVVEGVVDIDLDIERVPQRPREYIVSTFVQNTLTHKYQDIELIALRNSNDILLSVSLHSPAACSEPDSKAIAQVEYPVQVQFDEKPKIAGSPAPDINYNGSIISVASSTSSNWHSELLLGLIIVFGALIGIVYAVGARARRPFNEGYEKLVLPILTRLSSSSSCGKDENSQEWVWLSKAQIDSASIHSRYSQKSTVDIAATASAAANSSSLSIGSTQRSVSYRGSEISVFISPQPAIAINHDSLSRHTTSWRGRPKVKLARNAMIDSSSSEHNLSRYSNANGLFVFRHGYGFGVQCIEYKDSWCRRGAIAAERCAERNLSNIDGVRETVA
uniref:TMEM132 domain-containing protein n=1 Tax=Gongylonema pulchrum TaxID=637853 RepID=A0A183DTA8_9BILA